MLKGMLFFLLLMKTPTDLDAAIEQLVKSLSPEDMNILTNVPEKDMIKYHHFTGQYLRNEWGLWKGSPLTDYFNSLGITHADDMSGIILDSLWRHLNNQPIKLEEQVEFYKKYWEKMK